ncbi:MAG: DNA helicase RecQ [Bacteroidales bacterium]|jgi:ATP-dependent DNA helicase RecQ|nr:DNA helicase RecQ [Bacteroidales bacterium]
MSKIDTVYPDIQKKLKQFFGFDHFKGNQEKVIHSVLNGRNSFVIMPTGGGKSLCYQLPALVMEGTAIVISPLIALMKNQVDIMRSLSSEKSIAHVYNSSLNKKDQFSVRDDLMRGKIKLLYMAPESFAKLENIQMLKEIKISFYAIDEAHCISEWGHDFRPEYRRLRHVIYSIRQNVPIMALTATATPKVQHDIQKNLGMMNADIFLSSFDRPNLFYEVREKTVDIDKDIAKFIKKHPNKSGIIYCLSRKQVEDLTEFLVLNKIKAVPYHAGLDSSVRAMNQDMFLNEAIDVIVATIAFGMGIDKPDVRYVIHYNMPRSLEGYYQETGRAGRDGRGALCIAFYAYADIQKMEILAKTKPLAEQEIIKLLLSETTSYSESDLCRRKHLLFYFGEIYNKENCGSCDNCTHIKIMEEGKEFMGLLLETISELRQQFKEKHIINVLRGNMSTDIRKYKHNELKHFGEGQTKTEKFWQSLIRQALFEKLLVNNIDNYGVLKLTPEGEKFIKRPHSIKVVNEKKENEDDDAAELASPQKGGFVDKALFSMLKDLLKTIAKRENLPPYVIFQETSLEDMCVHYPTTVEEMTQITGVGTGKAQKYGKPFADLIRKYVEDNEIERPQDIVIKSAINKSGMKVYIIQNIDRKINLEDIAIAKNLTMDELLSEIESIVISGTKINIDYYIEQSIDLYRREEIMEYLHEKQEDSLDEVLSELGEEEYTMDEIRLMRIKFLSDSGN